jgi:hypothetical protein
MRPPNIQSNRWRISRRTFMRGAGASLALPWMESMAVGKTGGPPVRMACLFMPNGVNPKAWTPQGTGSRFELSPILQPLAEIRDDILVLSNLRNKASDTGDGHYVKTSGWLTGTTITKTTGKDLNAGNRSLDQVAAEKIGHLTVMPSIELGIDPVTTGVDTNVNYTRVYGSHISWSSETNPVPCEINPRSAFDRLFRKRNRNRKQSDDDRSILDLVMEDAKALRAKVGAADQQKLDQYLDSVRSVEKRIEADEQSLSAGENADPAAQKALEALNERINKAFGGRDEERQLGSTPRFDHTEHVRLMMDIMVLAFWTDSTRVGTFMFGNAVSGKNFSFLDGVKGGFHEISHHQNDAKQLEQYQRINTWHMQQYAYMLGRMKALDEGGTSLLSNSMVLCGSPLRDGNRHEPRNVPTVLAGQGGGTVKTGRHLEFDKDTPLCNLWVAMLDRVGAPVEKFADSSGALAIG